MAKCESGKAIRGFLAGVTIVAIVIAGGCAHSPRKFRPAQDPGGLDDTTFLHQLQTLPVVTVDEGMRAVLLLRGSTDQWPGYTERFAELKRLGAVREAWGLEPDARLDKGTLAYMVCRLAKLRPSVNDRLASVTGLGDRRYAMKTCVHEGVMPYAVEGEPVTGGELLAVLAQVEEAAQLAAGDDNSRGDGPNGP